MKTDGLGCHGSLALGTSSWKFLAENQWPLNDGRIGVFEVIDLGPHYR
jgi:hypothetical protein